MRNWWKRHTEYKDDREQFVMSICLFILFVPAILGGLILGIIKLVELGALGAQIIAFVAGGVLGSYLIDKWIKRGK